MNSITLSTAKYFEVAKTNYINSTAYLTNIIVRSITVIARIWIFTQLYRVTYLVNGIQTINGISVPMVIWLLMFNQSFQTSTRSGVMQTIEEEVKSGTLAYSLNRPYSYLLFHYFSHLGKTVPFLGLNLLIGIPAAYVLVGGISFSFAGILAGILLLFFGTTLDFLISFILGMTAFWVEDTSAFGWIYQKGQMVFGGAIFPLVLFPDGLRKIGELLPFSQLFYGAAQNIVSFDINIFSKFLSIQMFWLFIFGFLAVWIFSKGGKNVSINGG